MQTARPIKAVIFDMDGLLFDTEILYFEAMGAIAAKQGLEMPYDLYLAMVGSTREATNVRLCEHFGEDFAAQQFCEESREKMHQLAHQRDLLKPGVRELLDLLDARDLPRAIATSSARETAEQHLADHGLVDRFHTIVARGDYPHGKPHPAPYLIAAERLGADPRHCLALEDSANGIRSASAAGAIAVMVPDLLQPTEELRALCALVLRDLHEVRSLIDLKP